MPASVRRTGAVRQPLAWPALLVLLLVAALPSAAFGSAETAMTVLENMRAAYEQVDAYQARMEVNTAKADGSREVERFVYSFRKPRQVRLDMETPHPGAVVIYPDKNGNVYVKLRRKSMLPALHLRPDSRLLKGYAGHRIDQSDIGLLIGNISHSLTDQRRGPMETSEEGGFVTLRVLAADHFHPDMMTYYEFRIDEKTWLPSRVIEMTPEGRIKRITTLENMRINPDLPGSLFDTGRGEAHTGEGDGAE